MSKEQTYYELLVRTDHPVFYKDYSENTDVNSSINSIHNRIYARLLARARETVEELQANMYPETVTNLAIDDWENEYFGFVKSGVDLQTRVDELLIKFNKRFHMNVQGVIDLSRSITGVRPVVTRNVNKFGFTLGQSTLGASTIFTGGESTTGFYLVSFTAPVDSTLLKKLDERLTIIEKAGSRHKVFAPARRWIMGNVALGINSTLGAN